MKYSIWNYQKGKDNKSQDEGFPSDIIEASGFLEAYIIYVKGNLKGKRFNCQFRYSDCPCLKITDKDFITYVLPGNESIRTIADYIEYIKKGKKE